MADAKKCDITGEYYEPDKVQRKVIVQLIQDNGEEVVPDIGPTLQKKIEDLLGLSSATPAQLENPKKPRRKKRKAKKKAPKSKKAPKPKPAKNRSYKRTPRMQFVMQRADELEKAGMTRQQARKKAGAEWDKEGNNHKTASTPFNKKAHANGAKARIDDPARCTFCGTKIPHGQDICENCQAGMDTYESQSQA